MMDDRKYKEHWFRSAFKGKLSENDWKRIHQQVQDEPNENERAMMLLIIADEMRWRKDDIDESRRNSAVETAREAIRQLSSHFWRARLFALLAGDITLSWEDHAEASRAADKIENEELRSVACEYCKRAQFEIADVENF